MPSAQPVLPCEKRRSPRLTFLKSFDRWHWPKKHAARANGGRHFALQLTMAERRFPPPWSADELEACFVVRNSSRQAGGRQIGT